MLFGVSVFDSHQNHSNCVNEIVPNQFLITVVEFEVSTVHATRSPLHVAVEGGPRPFLDPLHVF